MEPLTYPVPLEEIAAVMCWAASEPDAEWKRGRREFYVIKRDMFGMSLEIRTKGDKVVLVRPTWRIIFVGGRVTYDDIGFRTGLRLPNYTYLTSEYERAMGRRVGKHRYVTAIGRCAVSEADFIIESRDAFARDWTLLRMFSSVWEEHLGAA